MQVKTGSAGLDALIGGLQVGDNVVWQASGPIDPAVIRSFTDAAGGPPLVYVSFREAGADLLARHRKGWARRDVLIIDCTSPATTPRWDGRSRHRIVRVQNPRDPADVLAALRGAEDSFRPGTVYVFDNLTLIQEAWGAEAALALFLEHCPRLYELRTIAYWFLQKEAHDQSFLARMLRTTQVVLDVTPSNGGHSLRVVKASDRPDAVGRRADLSIRDDRIELSAPHVKELAQVGEALRTRRTARGIKQAELARRLGISPSALSQAERGSRGLSEETLASAYAILGDEGAARAPYTLARRRGRRSRELTPGLTTEDVLEDASRMSVHLLTFDAGSSGRRPPFATKQKEVVVVVAGVLELKIGAASEVLQTGDAIVLRDEPVSAWSNPASSATRVLWCVLPPTEGATS